MKDPDFPMFLSVSSFVCAFRFFPCDSNIAGAVLGTPFPHNNCRKFSLLKNSKWYRKTNLPSLPGGS